MSKNSKSSRSAKYKRMNKKGEIEPLSVNSASSHVELSDMQTKIEQEKKKKEEEKKKKKKRKKKPLTKAQKIWKFIDKFFMIICLAWIIPLAVVWPIGHNAGPLYPQISSSWVVTIILFFGIGLGVKLEYLKRACLFWQMNIFCHFIFFVYYPLIGFLIWQIANFLPDGVVSPSMFTLLEGIQILCCLPATAASAVVFTINADGNEAAAAINCTMSQLLGIFVTPALILVFMGSTTEIDAVEVLWKLSARIIAPFFVAQIIRMVIGDVGRAWIKKKKIWIKKMNEIALLYMVFCALSQTFYVGIDAKTVDIIIFLLLIIVLHTQGYGAIWVLSSMFRCCLGATSKHKSSFMAFTKYDRIACIYSGVSKSIAFGIPIIETIYETDDRLGFYIMPILFYHPCNLIIGSFFVEPFKKMAKLERTALGSYFTNTTLTHMSQITHGTDYGTLQPFEPQKLDHIEPPLFEPFAPLPDEPEEYEEVDDNNNDDNDINENDEENQKN